MIREKNEQNFWPAIESKVSGEGVRSDLRRVLERKQDGGGPDDGTILDALLVRERHEQDLNELNAMLAADRSTPAALLTASERLLEWGIRRFATQPARGVVCLDFRHSVAAHKLYGTQGKEPTSVELLWGRAMLSEAKSLWSLMHKECMDPQPLHRLVQDVEALLAGTVVDLAGSTQAVDLVLKELKQRETFRPALAAAEAEARKLEVARQREEGLMREHADSPWGRRMLKTLLRRGGAMKTEDLLRDAISDEEARAEARGTTRDSSLSGREKHGRKIEETLRVMRDRCLKPSGCAPCADHLGLITSPRRGTNVLTEKGKAFAAKLR